MKLTITQTVLGVCIVCIGCYFATLVLPIFHAQQEYYEFYQNLYKGNTELSNYLQFYLYDTLFNISVYGLWLILFLGIVYLISAAVQFRNSFELNKRLAIVQMFCSISIAVLVIFFVYKVHPFDIDIVDLFPSQEAANLHHLYFHTIHQTRTSIHVLLFLSPVILVCSIAQFFKSRKKVMVEQGVSWNRKSFILRNPAEMKTPLRP